MARRSNLPPPAGPTITKQEGRKRLSALLVRAETLLQARPLKEGQVDVWSTATLEAIKATFGEDSGHLYTFCGTARIIVSDGMSGYDHYAEERDAEEIQRQSNVVRTLIEQIELEVGFEAPQSPITFWDDLHPSVIRVAKDLFEGGHFAASVEAALKELNVEIKQYVLRKANRELDGAALMHTAFSPNDPLVVLADQSNQTSRDIQQGYMELYAGAMIGIRNPKAHENIRIDAVRAKHFLYLASLLFFAFQERL